MHETLTIPNQYQCDHLFLLIGTNPLPNFVAAKLLLKQNGKIYLVHSSEDAGTATIAKRLSNILGKSPHNIPSAHTIEVKEADAANIYTQVAKAARGLSGLIGLHYTGGTKAMAIHAYRAITSLGRQAVFSYLDSRTLTLRIEPLQGEAPPTFPVGLAVKPLIRELTALHGEPILEGRFTQEAVMADAAGKLADACADRSHRNAWRAWCSETLRAEQVHTGKDWKNESTLQQIELDWPADDRLSQILQEAFEQINMPRLSLKAARNSLKMQKCAHVCAWLDGLWLENYVLWQVSQTQGDTDLHDYGMTLKTAPNLGAEHDFEADVAALRGYQFFQITCTTSTTKSLSKSKLFEAFERARQLGGDEARVGLVTLYEQTATLEREVQQRWHAEGKVRVFGPEHLPQLADHLRQWFSTAG